MSDALETRAEILKLARLLGRDPVTLSYMESVPPADIRTLREQTTELLFTAHGGALDRLAAASRLLPVGLVAMLGENVFGPVLAARFTGLLEPSRAVEMAAKLPVTFLADVAIELDPRRANAVIGRMPTAQVQAVALELIRREEYVTMGRFVGVVGDEAVVAALRAMDDRQLLQVAFVLEDKRRLDHLVGLLAPERLDGIIDAAATAGLWPEALDLLSHLSEERRRQFAALPGIGGEGVLEAIVATAAENRLWEVLLPLVALLAPEAQLRVAVAAAALDVDDETLASFTGFVADLPLEQRRTVLALATAAGALDKLGPIGAALKP